MQYLRELICFDHGALCPEDMRSYYDLVPHLDWFVRKHLGKRPLERPSCMKRTFYKVKSPFHAAWTLEWTLTQVLSYSKDIIFNYEKDFFYLNFIFSSRSVTRLSGAIVSNYQKKSPFRTK